MELIKLNEQYNYMNKLKLDLQYFAGATINGSSTASNCDCKIVWSSTATQSTNKSKVTATIYVYKSGSSETTCTFSGTITIDGTAYSVSKKDTWSWGSWHAIGSASKTVTHNDDGKKSITIKGSVKTPTSETTMSGTYSASGTAVLDNIPRQSILGNIDNFKIDDSITLSITKYVSTYTDTLEVLYGDTVVSAGRTVVDGDTFAFTDDEKTAIQELMSSQQIALTFKLTTTNGTTAIGSSSKNTIVISLGDVYFRDVIKKANGQYQVAFNGKVYPNNPSPMQVYDDNGNDFLHPIGQILITKDNAGATATDGITDVGATSPELAAKYGGTWTLKDKDFIPIRKNATAGVEYTRNTTNCTAVGTFSWIRAGHTINIAVRFTNKVQIATSALTMFTINLNELGISRFWGTYRAVGWTDVGGCAFFYGVNATSGVFSTTNVIPDNYISAGRTDNSANIEFTVTPALMLDSACDKFYWERTA